MARKLKVITISAVVKFVVLGIEATTWCTLTWLLSVNQLVQGQVSGAFVELSRVVSIVGEDPLATVLLDLDEDDLPRELDRAILFEVELHTILKGETWKLEQLGKFTDLQLLIVLVKELLVPYIRVETPKAEVFFI